MPNPTAHWQSRTERHATEWVPTANQLASCFAHLPLDAALDYMEHAAAATGGWTPTLHEAARILIDWDNEVGLPTALEAYNVADYDRPA